MKRQDTERSAQAQHEIDQGIEVPKTNSMVINGAPVHEIIDEEDEDEYVEDNNLATQDDRSIVNRRTEPVRRNPLDHSKSISAKNSKKLDQKPSYERSSSDII